MGLGRPCSEAKWQTVDHQGNNEYWKAGVEKGEGQLGGKKTRQKQVGVCGSGLHPAVDDGDDDPVT